MHALVLQCGGPTAVVNVTLAALVRRWKASADGTLFGGRFGLAALRSGDWLPLSSCSAGPAGAPGTESWLSALDGLPGMALGGGRDFLRAGEVDAAIAGLAAADIQTLFLIGGSGTMRAGRVVAERAAAARVPLRVVGVPKTIDNDIPETDLCPGYPSAARFLIEAVRDVAADVASMRGYEDVVLVEAMGRHSGWLAAATALARAHPGDAPHLVLLPERPVDVDGFLEAVRRQHARAAICVVTVAEGVRNAAGVFLAEIGAPDGVERDAAGQVILGRSGGPLPYLAALVRERARLRCRLVRPDVLQRCSTAHVVPFDREIAALAGAAAVDAGSRVEPDRPVMVALRRRSHGWGAEPVPLQQVDGERTLPQAIQADPQRLRPLLYPG